MTNEKSWMIVLDSTGLAVAEVFSDTPPAPFDGTHWINKRTGVCALCNRNTIKDGYGITCTGSFKAMRPSEYLPTLNKRNTANDN